MKKRKKLLKQGMSIALCAALMAGMLHELPADFFYKIANANVDVEYKPEKLGVKVLPDDVLKNSRFMHKYVNGRESGDYTITSGFKLTSSKNLKKENEYNKKLTYKKEYMHNGNNHWEAKFENSLSNANSAYDALIKKGDIYIGYNVDLVSDYHKHIGKHGGKKWDIAKYEIGGKTSYQKISAEKKNDGGNQNYNSDIINLPKDAGRYLYLKFDHEGCNCGSSKAKNNSVYLVDKKNPKLVKVYGTTDVNGKNKIGKSGGFKAGQSGYIVLEFDENIRFASGIAEELNLKTNLTYTETDQEVTSKDAQVTAVLKKLVGNKLIFKFDVPSKLAGSDTNVYIDSIPTAQPWMSSSKDLTYTLLDENGNKYDIGNAGEFKCNSKITDLAGNPVTLGKDYFNLENYIYLDNVQPSVSKISAAIESKIDKSSVYAGVGDTLTFKCIFSEELKISDNDKSKVKAVLNIKDNAGNPVKLELDSNKAESAKDWISNDSKTDNVGILVFKSLDITAGMKPSNTDASAIKIVKIEGLDSATDCRGNAIKSGEVSNIKISPDNQIYLDVLEPKAETTLTKDNDIYITSVKGYEFTIPVIIKDDEKWGKNDNYPSGIKGSGKNYVKGSFSLVLSQGNDVEYEWYVDTNETISNNANWKKSKASSSEEASVKNEFIEVDANANCIHIRLDENKDYAYNDNILNAAIIVYPKDWAGNTKSYKFKIKHNVDSVSPVVESLSCESSISNSKVYMNAQIHVQDKFGVSDIKYFWENGKSCDVNIESLDKTNLTFEAKDDFTKTTESGTRELTVIVTDISGNNTKFTKEYGYYFQSVKSKYTMADKGSKSAPVIEPDIVVDTPDKINVSEAEMNLRTMMLIPAGKEKIGESEKDTYLAFMSGVSGGTSTDRNCFEGLPKSEDEDYSSYPYKDGYWYKVYGEIGSDGTGTFVKMESYSDSTLYKAGKIVNSLYGNMNIIFVTSTDLAQNDTFSFGGDLAKTLVEKEEVYFATKFDYNVSFLTFNDENGENIETGLCVDKVERVVPSINRIPSIKNVHVGLDIVNKMEGETPLFGCFGIDASNSYFTLNKINEDGTMGEVVYTENIQAVKNQNITFADCDISETGLYGIKVHVKTKDNVEKDYEPDKYIFIDTSSATLQPDKYIKTYVHDSNEAITTRDEVIQGSSVNVGIADKPLDNISSDSTIYSGAKNRLYFKASHNKDTLYSPNCSVEFRWKIKVWSSLDINGENNAKWYDLSDVTEGYQLVSVSEFKESVYTDGTDKEGKFIPVLPLGSGKNYVNYQIKGINNEIYTGELIVNAQSKAPDVNVVENKTPTKSEIDLKIDNDTIISGGSVEWYKNSWNDTDREKVDISDLKTYEFVSAMNNIFCVYDIYGNMTVKEYEVTDVDGVGPECFIPSGGDGIDDEIYLWGSGYRFKVTVTDDTKVSIEDTYLTFDSEYSALLMGLTGDEKKENNKNVSVKIPVNTTPNKDGKMIWSSLTDDYYGIYRTEIIHMDDKSYTIDVWGTFKFDKEKEMYDVTESLLTVSAYDALGNSSDESQCAMQSFSRNNEEPMLILPEEAESGKVVVASNVPLKSISGYGAGKLERKIDDYGYENYETTLDMIVSDGAYSLELTDIFGQTFESIIEVVLPNEARVNVKYSTTEKTNKNVVAVAKLDTSRELESSAYDEYENGSESTEIIDSIEGYYDDSADKTKSDVKGSVDRDDKKTASIEMEKNGKVVITTSLGRKTTFKVSNIDKELAPATINYLYDGNSMPDNVDENTDTIKTPVVAVLECEEDVEGVNDRLRYEFPYESKKGDTYTFEYKDEAGNVGKLTATLPYNIDKKPEETSVENDTEPPEYEMLLFGMRNGCNEYLADFMEDGSEVSEAAKYFVAQKYGVVVNITDDSRTKIILKKSGASAPTSYDSKSDSVEGVKVSKTTVTVSENVKFDLYIVDEKNNVTAITGFDFTSIDNKVPDVSLEYELFRDTDGYDVVRVWLVPEGNEEIYTSDKNVMAVIETEKYIDEYGVEDERKLLKYYKEYKENSNEKFTYTDFYGNSGQIAVEVNAIDVTAPVVNSIEWSGIGEYQKPEDVKNAVNKDVIAILKVSKAASTVKFYEYDSSKEDNKGKEITDESIVTAGIAGTTINITFKNNTSGVIVAEITAAKNARSYVLKLPQITIIDKKKAEITLESDSLAANKLTRTFTFKSDEPVLYSGGTNDDVLKNQHVITVAENGTKTFKFTDAAGNITRYDVNVTDIDDKQLALKFSTKADGSGAEDNVKNMKLQSGQNLYVMANKAAVISTDSIEKTVSAGQWVEIKLMTESGVHVLNAVDSVTGNKLHYNLLIDTRDTIVPQIAFDTNTVYLKENASVNDMKKAIESGVTVTDNRDGVINDFNVSGVPDTVKKGYYMLTYSATDLAGNTKNAVRMLYIAGIDEAVLSLNKKSVAPYNTTVFQAGDIVIDAESESDSGLMIKFMEGIWTTGQMKYCNNVVKNGGTVTANNPGYYTVYVRTRDRAEFVTYIYVDEQ